MPMKALKHNQHVVKPARPPDKRGSSTQQGYGARWRKARLHFITRNPLCAECQRQGKTTAANEVDHVIPWKGDLEKFWNENNWEAKCKPCHSAKTAKENNGIPY